MAKQKYDLNRLRTIAASSGSPKEFLVEAKKAEPGISDAYARVVYYDSKRKSASPISVSETGEQISTFQPTVQEVSSGDVQIVTTAENTESKELKESYAKLLEEETGEKVNVEEEGTSSGSPDVLTEGSSEETSKPQQRLALGRLMEQAIISINDNLIWTERHLNETEKTNISQFSDDAEASFDALDLNDPNAVWYNLAIAGFLIPTISRADLIPKKVQKIAEWIQSFQKPVSQNPVYTPAYNGPTIVQGAPMQEKILDETSSKEASEPEGDIDEYTGGMTKTAVRRKFKSDNVVAWLESSIDSGYVAAPRYDPNAPLDATAYREKKLIRNLNDTFVVG